LISFAEKAQVMPKFREKSVSSGKGEPDGKGPGNPVRPEREQR